MLITRLAGASDIPYVLDSFTEEFKNSVYADGLTRIQVRQLLLDVITCHRGWIVSVLCEEEVPDEIVSYAVWRTSAEVAWVHTKGKYRRKAFRAASTLLRLLGVTKGGVKTPFIPSPAFARAARDKGWELRHRPWMGAT